VMVVPKTTRFTDATGKTVQVDAFAGSCAGILGSDDPVASDRKGSVSMTGH